MKHWTRSLLALAASAGLAAGCQDASTPAPEPTEASPDAQPARSTAEVWSEILVNWAGIQELASASRKSIEQFEQMDGLLANLTALAEELENSLQMPDLERRQMGQSIMVLRGSMLELESTVSARIPGELAEAMVLVASQLWVVQERFPPGELPGEPLPQPEGIGMPSS